ncbi:hypothetical protein JAAARDRAFT_318910 [Jaapia argillacea MUCL 33604]|uniref:Uncharacterized protein n=1 Tax=Jaapia argillacea MUCL 33604 TaxID=933084 RepID=A0A067PMN3_9AGAM|nr:hypothetical protein JAAARDRAFT_318910 [Jaapia argillacea MUCL 33604]
MELPSRKAKFAELGDTEAKLQAQVDALQQQLTEAQSRLTAVQVERAQFSPFLNLPVEITTYILELGHQEFCGEDPFTWKYTFRNTIIRVSRSLFHCLENPDSLE